MNPVTLALTEPTWRELTSWLGQRDEVAGVLTARVISDTAGTTLLGRQLTPAPTGAYLDRRRDGLALRSSGWVPAVRRSHADDAMALFVHTHPCGRAQFSRADDTVDELLSGPFTQLAGVPRYGSLVLAGSEGRPSFAGRTWPAGGPRSPIDQLRIVGDRLTIIGAEDVDDEVHGSFDRQVRMLGAAGQRRLARLRVGIVGAGGTGSAVAEQLVRLGAGTLVVVDDDVVTPTTIARGYGSSLADAGRPKVDVIAELASRVGLGTVIEAVHGNLRSVAVAQRLRHCDVVFSCVDGHAARVVLNRWAYAHLAPVIDVGVLVSSDAGRVTGVDGRVTWLSPGAACLLCRERIDASLAYAESLSPEERTALTRQGYAPALEEPQPSVVTYTSLVASYATTELLHRLFGLADPAPTEMIVRMADRSVRLNRRGPRPGCSCTQPALVGRGLRPPYLDVSWAS